MDWPLLRKYVQTVDEASLPHADISIIIDQLSLGRVEGEPEHLHLFLQQIGTLDLLKFVLQSELEEVEVVEAAAQSGDGVAGHGGDGNQSAAGAPVEQGDEQRASNGNNGTGAGAGDVCS